MPQTSIESILKNEYAYINCCVVNSTTTYHSHNFVEIAYVAEGEGTHKVNGVNYHASKGDLFLINYDIPHEFIPESRSMTVYNCIFTPAYFNSTLRESRNFFDITDHFLLTNLYTNLPNDYIFVRAIGSENNHILSIYNRMLQEFTAKQIGYRDIIRGYVIELMVIICRLKLSINSGRTQKMIELLDHINAHFKENIDSDALAASIGFSASHFRRVFKSLTGKTLSLYIQTLRIEEACRLLKSSEMNVSQIAEQVGYSDIKHFYSVFKRITGKLPKAFRNVSQIEAK